MSEILILMGITTQMNHIIMRKNLAAKEASWNEKIKLGQMDYVAQLAISGYELDQQKGFNGLNYQAPWSSKEQRVN